MSLIWRKIVTTQRDCTFEDPICCSQVDITVYTEMYGPFLDTLDGQDELSFVDMFFRKSLVNTFHWEFIDSDARADFVDMCQEMGLIDDLKRIREGTSTLNIIEKSKTKTQTKTQTQKIEEKPKAKPLTEHEKKEKILAQRLHTIDILQQQLALTTLAEAKRIKNLTKIRKMQAQIQEDLECDPIYQL